VAPNDALLVWEQKQVDKEEALAICFANLKGSKDKDLLGTARALQYLRGLHEYSSNEKLGKAVGASGETVREFLTLLKLPKKIQSLFEQRELRSLEQGRRLWQLARNRPELLQETAHAISNITAWDGRHVIDYILRNPQVSAIEAKRAVMESKTIVEHEFHVVAIISEEDYRLLADEARKRRVPVDILVTSIVQEWLKSRGHNV
jgi:hypothetical protein